MFNSLAFSIPLFIIIIIIIRLLKIYIGTTFLINVIDRTTQSKRTGI